MMTIWYKSHIDGLAIGLEFTRLEDAQHCWDVLEKAGCIMLCTRP